MTTTMNKYGLHAVAALTVVLLLVNGCATHHDAPFPSSESVGEHPSATINGAVDVEEIVVTGSRINRRHQEYDDDQSYAAATPLAYDEELWIIARPDAGTGADTDSPGTGAMLASYVDPANDAVRTVPMPLQHTAVSAEIDGYISSVNVKQQFANPFDTKIEATYLFPLPEKAAISEFVMVIGERRIRGILRDKDEAQTIYAAARDQGYRASLLVQKRPNVFEQKVANIEPGHAIDIDIRYFHTVPYRDGWYSFEFPTVVGPRYNPSASDDPIHAVARGSESNGETAVPYLQPGERTAHDISIDVAINAGVAIEELSASHKISALRPESERAVVKLAAGSTMPNEDFVLRYRVAGEQVQTNLVTHREPGRADGYFTLMLYPPESSAALERRPLEMVFVLDCSGSMAGRPMAQAKSAVSAALARLQPTDTFQIIRFSDNTSQFGDTPVAATRENIRAAKQYLKDLSSDGGTQMIKGVQAALDFPHDPQRLRFVTFMTDGYIGNEAQILAAVDASIGASRIFSFGVGSSVNRYLMERMAKLGRGAVAYLGSRDSASDIMDDFFARISRPAMTDLQIDWGALAPYDIYPAEIPDLFVGRPVVITGRYAGAADTVRVTGLQGTEQRELQIAAAASASDSPALPKIWARLRIADLVDRRTVSLFEKEHFAIAIRATALQHQLVSDYTAFVAVDASEITEGAFGVTVPQAVPVPDGVRYETSFDSH